MPYAGAEEQENSERNGIGQVLKIISTDPGSSKDIPAWARVTGNELLEETTEGGKYVFYVKKLK